MQSFGLAYADAEAVYNGIDRSFATVFVVHNGLALSPQEINDKAANLKGLMPERRNVVVVGDESAMTQYALQLSVPDTAIFLADVSVLDNLGIDCVDRDFPVSGKQVQINQLI